MRPIIVEMKEMSDSTEVYESRPHPFFKIFIYLLLVIVIIAFIWMYFSKIDIMAKATGLVKTEDDSSTVTNIVGGAVVTVNITDGQEVKQGDVLYEIDTQDSQRQLAEYNTLLTDVNDRLVIMEEYLKVLNGVEENLDSLSGNQYYEDYSKRLKLVNINCSSLNTDVDSQKTQYEASLSSLNNSLSYNNAQLDKLKLMMNSVKEVINYFDSSQLYYYTSVESYIKSYNSLQSQYDKQIEALKIANADNTDIEEVKKEKEEVLNNLELENIATVEQQIQSMNDTIVSIGNSIHETEAKLNTLSTDSIQNSILNVKVSEINSVNTEINTYKSQKAELESNVAALDENISKAKVRAEQDGVINLSTELVEGNYLDAGTQVMTIIPDYKSSYIVEVYINNKDIGSIEKGINVKYEVAAFPSSEYGNMTGEVLSISKDVKVSDDGSAYYIAKASVDNDVVINSDGEEGSLKVGMACEAKMITDRKRVLIYLLEKINIFD